MADVPDPDFFFPNMAVGFTEFGTPTYGPDLHNPAPAAVLGDELDNRLQRAAVIATGNTKFSATMWVKTTDPTTIDEHFINQFNLGSGSGMFLSLAPSGRFDIQARTSATASTITHAASTLGDDVYQHIGLTIDGKTGVSDAELKLFLAGIQPSYSGENLHTGNGFGSFPAGTGGQAFSVGGSPDFARFFNGSIARLKLWINTALTTAEMLQENINEVAAIGSNNSLFPDGSTPRISLYPG